MTSHPWIRAVAPVPGLVQDWDREAGPHVWGCVPSSCSSAHGIQAYPPIPPACPLYPALLAPQWTRSLSSGAEET